MNAQISVRKYEPSDRSFVLSLSRTLAEVVVLDWHCDDAIQNMQDAYIKEMLETTSVLNITFIATKEENPLDFIHARLKQDGISGEAVSTIPLLAVSQESQGLGIGATLIKEVEKWAKEVNCRLLHLEVFESNRKAKVFYSNLGFKPEIVNMLKEI